MNKAFQQLSEELADLVSEKDGELVCPCTVCKEDTMVECDIEDLDPTNHYCGRTPRCCP